LSVKRAVALEDMDNGGSVSFRKRYAGIPGELNSKRRLNDEKRDLNEMDCVEVTVFGYYWPDFL
jgi:hypothetical protein